MDCLVALLPSEIARLVYGYLLNEKCPKAAQSFLDESPNLQECRKVAYSGRPFTTRVSNWALLDILEAFCQVNYIVQETADKLNRPDKLKHSNDLISKIQFLLEVYACYQSHLGGEVSLTKNLQNVPPVDKLPLGNEQRSDDGSQNIPEKISQNLEVDSQGSVSPSSAASSEDDTGYQDHLQTKKETQIGNLDQETNEKSPDPKKPLERIHQGQLADHFETNNGSQDTQENEKSSSPQKAAENPKKYVDSEVQTSLALLTRSPHDPTKQKLQKCTQSEVRILEIGHCMELNHATRIENSEEEVKCLTDSGVQVSSTLTCKKLNDGTTDTTQNKCKNLSKPKIVSIENFKSHSLPVQRDSHTEISLPNSQMKLPSFSECFKHPRIIEQKSQMFNAVMNSIYTNSENLVENCNKQDDPTKDKGIVQKNNGRTEIFDNRSASPRKIDSNDESLRASETNVQNDLRNVDEHMCIFKSPSQVQHFPAQNDEFFSQNNTSTSTPLKPLAHQNFDISNWFSTQINTPPTVHHRDTVSASLDTNYLYTQTTNNIIVSSSINTISPIISTATSQIDEGIIPNGVSTNIVQGSILPLARVGCSSRDNFSCNTNLESPLRQKKAPLMQKSSGELNDLLNTPSLQKSGGSANNPSPVSKSSSELNKILGIDSIMLYGMDNNATSLHIPLVVQEIEMEDSITFTGTGLSPFLKKSNPGTTDTVPEHKCNVKTDYTSRKTPNKCPPSDAASAAVAAATVVIGSSDVKNNVEFLQKKINIDDVIKCNTPQSLLENRTKNKRSSFTSPKKKNSCVRALDFDKNLKQCMSDGKIQDPKSTMSPTSLRRELVKKKLCKASLFQSPPHNNSNADEQKFDHADNFEDVETPLSTETSECTAETGKKKAAPNDDVIPKRRSSSKENDDNVVLLSPKKGIVEKKSWDSDLRKHLCIPEPPPNKTKRRDRVRVRKRRQDSTEQVSPPKKIRKSDKSAKKTGKSKKKTSPETEKDPNQEVVDDENEDRKTKESSEKFQPKKMESTEKERDSLEMILSDSINNDEIVDEEAVQKLASEELEKLNKVNEIDAKNTSSEKDDSGIAEKMQMDEESLTTAFKKISDGLAAKYFSDQTPEPTSQIQKEQRCPEVVAAESQEAAASEDVVYAKIEMQLKEITGGGSSQRQPIYDEVTQTSADGRLVQKKYARVRTLKPGEAPGAANCLLGLEDSPRKDEDSLQVPPTPRVLSPGSSMLVMPLSKHSEDSHTLASLVATTTLECPLTPGAVLSPPKLAAGAPSHSKETEHSQPSLAATFRASNPCEIPKFGAIQENFFQPNNGPTEPDTVSLTAYVPEEPMVYRENENVIKTDATSTTSSCHTSCSDCSSSVSEDENNNGSDSEEETDREVADENQIEDQEEGQCDGEVENESEIEKGNEKRLNITVNTAISKRECQSVGNLNGNVSTIIEEAGEISPTKILLTERNNAGVGKIEETPAKDDVCQEAEIFETPNVSKPCENRTNLNDKIDEIMVTKEREMALEGQNKLKPKIKSIEFDVPKIVVKPQFECSSKMQTRASSIRNISGETTNQRIKFEKSEDEIAKAIESITVLEEEKIRQVQEDLEMSVDSCNESSPYKDDSSSKKELVRAIESITRMNYGAEDSVDESSGEAHLKLILADEGVDESKGNESKNDSYLNRSAEHGHNTRLKSRQKRDSSGGNSKCKANDSDINKEIHFEYEYNERRKKRRKGFSNSDLVRNYCYPDGDGTVWTQISSNKFEEMFAMKPARKKPVRRASKNVVLSSDEEDDDDDDDYVDTVKTDGFSNKGTKQIGLRRKRRVENETAPTKKRRQKSKYIY